MTNKPLICCELVVKKSPIHGFGIFANQTILAGAIIEECYALPIKPNEQGLINYYFGTGEGGRVLPLGYGAIYNHSDQPNAEYQYIAERSLIVFYANRLIKKGEEICSSYGENWFSSRRMLCKKTLRSKWQRFVSPLMLLSRFTIVTSILLAIAFWLPKK